MNRPVTLRDIAAKTGFQPSTVSMALRCDPRISSATRETIARVAAEMGYQPDPMLKALSIYRRSVKPAHYHATLAWFSNTTEPQTENPDYVFKCYVDGARARGEELGYKIEEFPLCSPGMTPNRLEKILKARGIDGILVGPQPNVRMKARIAMNWAPFYSVAFGYSLAWPPIHRVSAYHAGGAKLAVRKLYSLGYRRIGLSIDHCLGGRVDGNWLGGYLSEMTYRGLEPQVFFRTSRSSKVLLLQQESLPFRAWILKNKIEALIFDCSQPFIGWLQDACGLQVPDDIGVASLNVQSDDSFHSGIDQHEFEIGRRALETLVNLINARSPGIPEISHKVMVDGTWSNGHTVRCLESRTRRNKP